MFYRQCNNYECCFFFFLHTACPLGSYKNFPSPEKCTGCPKNSNTAKTGSTSIEDCSCKVGYQGDPKKGIECTGMWITFDNED